MNTRMERLKEIARKYEKVDYPEKNDLLDEIHGIYLVEKSYMGSSFSDTLTSA